MRAAALSEACAALTGNEDLGLSLTLQLGPPRHAPEGTSCLGRARTAGCSFSLQQELPFPGAVSSAELGKYTEGQQQKRFSLEDQEPRVLSTVQKWVVVPSLPGTQYFSTTHGNKKPPYRFPIR